MTDTQEPAPANVLTTKHPRRIAREPRPERAEQIAAHAPPKRASKTGLVLGLLQRLEGATIDQLVAATGWLSHTTREALTGLRKKGPAGSREKIEDQRYYRIVNGAA